MNIAYIEFFSITVAVVQDKLFSIICGYVTCLIDLHYQQQSGRSACFGIFVFMVYSICLIMNTSLSNSLCMAESLSYLLRCIWAFVQEYSRTSCVSVCGGSVGWP